MHCTFYLRNSFGIQAIKFLSRLYFVVSVTVRLLKSDEGTISDRFSEEPESIGAKVLVDDA